MRPQAFLSTGRRNDRRRASRCGEIARKGGIWKSPNVLQWIKENVPCFNGNIPAKWT
jgi:hypothetical protein